MDKAFESNFELLTSVAPCCGNEVSLNELRYGWPSGFAKFSKQDFPFDDTRAYTTALLQAFGPDHCVWASDWPFLRAPRRLDYGPLLQLFAQMVPDPQDRQKILWDTPKRLFGFT